MHAVMAKRRPNYCSFCGKRDHEVFCLVAGPQIFICDECVAAAQQIVTDKKLQAGASAVIARVPKSAS